MKIHPTTLKRHENCECYVERHYMQKGGKLKSINNALVEEGEPAMVPALMCRTHGKWLKWLSESEARAIEDLTDV